MSRAEPSQFSWTGENQNNKPPAKRIPHKTVVEEYKLPLTETIDESISALACDDFIDTSLKLLKLKLTQSLTYKRISLPWELKSPTASKNLLKQRKKMQSLADSKFSSTRANMIIVPFCFYTGLPSYEALIYFSAITKIPKMEYGKGENSL